VSFWFSAFFLMESANVSDNVVLDVVPPLQTSHFFHETEETGANDNNRDSQGARSNRSLVATVVIGNSSTSKDNSSLSSSAAKRRMKGIGNEKSLAPWSSWRETLRPAAPERRTDQEGEFALGDDSEAEADDENVALLKGMSLCVRSIVLQFVFELKLRAFGSRRMLEQELRKKPSKRFFLKLWPEYTSWRPKAHRLWIVRVAQFVSGTMPRLEQLIDVIDSNILHWFAGFLCALLRGAGQAMLANNPIAGLLALAGLVVTSPWLFVCSLFGLVCATVCAQLLGVNSRAVRAGLFGYNVKTET
jgi:hypothetical protein